VHLTESSRLRARRSARRCGHKHFEHRTGSPNPGRLRRFGEVVRYANSAAALITVHVCSDLRIGRSRTIRIRLDAGSGAMWTYLLGPFFALLPRWWRDLLVRPEDVHWGRAAAISGFAEAGLALYALGRWYYYAMSTCVGNAVAAALSGQNGGEISPQAIGGVALTIWVTHPVTLLLGYAGFEGAVRMCAGAFSGNAYGTLPLFLADKILFSPFRRRKPLVTDSPRGVRGNISSFAGAVRETAAAGSLPGLPDEIRITKNTKGEILEISACQRKQDWTPSSVVRYLNAYYCLEADSRGSGLRPFCYQLRRLPAGVPGRKVLSYAPPDAMIQTDV